MQYFRRGRGAGFYFTRHFFFYYQSTTGWGNHAITENTTWDTRSFPDNGYTCQHFKARPRRVSGNWDPTTAVQERPTPAPGTSRPLTLRSGSGRGRRGRGRAASPGRAGSPLLFLGSDRRRPGCDYVSPQTHHSKAKVPPREMVVPDAPPPSTPANHRVAAALGQSDAAVPSSRRLPPRATALPGRWVFP